MKLCYMFDIILHYMTLHSIIWRYMTLYEVIWHYMTLYYIILHYITLYYIILHYITLYYIVLHCIILYHFIFVSYINVYVFFCRYEEMILFYLDIYDVILNEWYEDTFAESITSGLARTGPGETIFQEGQKSEDVFIVLKGTTETPDKQHLHIRLFSASHASTTHSESDHEKSSQNDVKENISKRLLFLDGFGLFLDKTNRSDEPPKRRKKPGGFVQLQLLRDESDLGSESQRPKAPVNEAILMSFRILGLEMLSFPWWFLVDVSGFCVGDVWTCFFFHCVWSCRFLQVFKVFGIYVLQFVLEVKDWYMKDSRRGRRGDLLHTLVY